METEPITGADAGVALRQEVNHALDALSIQPTNIYANGRWTKWVIHRVPAMAGNTNILETGTILAQEIQNSTELILAELPRWLTRPEVLTQVGHGTIVVSLLGNLVNIGATTITLFNRRCWWEKARPDHCNAQCFRYQSLGHQQEQCKADFRYGVCAENHPTTYHKCTNRVCPGGPKCNHPSIRCANCPAGASGLHKALDYSCPAHAKSMLKRQNKHPTTDLA